VEDFHFGLDQSVLIGSTSGGTGGGKLSVQDFVVNLGSSIVIPGLGAALAAGTVIPKLELEVYGGSSIKGPSLISEYKFDNVLVNALETNGSNDNELSFNFAKYSQAHAYPDVKGGPGDAYGTGWDLIANSGGTAPNPSPDAPVNNPSALLQTVPQGTQLDYYVRFEGSGLPNDWLKVENIDFGLMQSGSIHVGSGGSMGKASASDVSLTLGTSSMIAYLAEALSNGTNIKHVEIEAYAPSALKAGSLVDEYNFQTVLLTGLNSSGQATNELSFAFGRYGHGHQEVGGGSSVGGWDFLENKEWTPSSPSADVDLFA